MVEKYDFSSSSRKHYLTRSPVLCSDCKKRLKVFKRKKKCILCQRILCRHCFPNHITTCVQGTDERAESSRHQISPSVPEDETKLLPIHALDGVEAQEDVYFKSPREDQEEKSPIPFENITEPSGDIRVKKSEKYGGSSREDFVIEEGQSEYREAIILQKVITSWTQKRARILSEVVEHQNARKQRNGIIWRNSYTIADDEADFYGRLCDIVASVTITILVWILFSVLLYLYIICGRARTTSMLT